LNGNINIKDLEKKAWKSTFQDGLWDIYIGMVIMGLGLTWIGSLIGLSETLDVLIVIFSWDMGAFLIFFLGKKFITVPRIGYVKFGKVRKKRNKILSIFIGFMVMFTVITFIFTLLGLFQLSLPGYLVMLLIGLVFITVPFSTLAFFIQLNRLYIYAFLGGLGLFGSELLSGILYPTLADFIVFGIIGGMITLTGFVILAKFLKKYPKSKKEVS
jgi:hypothetical protein